MGFQKSQPAGAATLVPPSASTGPLKNMDASPQHEKRTPAKYTKKLTAFRTLANCHGPYGAKRRRSSPQSRCGGEPPPCAALNYPDASHPDCCQL